MAVEMEAADFSGYATKSGLKCSDGRTIMPGAFKHQDQSRVPLVWQHGHSDPENVLGHAMLESRDDGIYAHGYFNKSSKAGHAKTLLEHRDISMLSIWANELVERAGRVLHGSIREVSLVLSGANPGAVIENVSIRHSDGSDDTLDDEAIIYTGLEFELRHSDTEIEEVVAEEVVEEVKEVKEEVIEENSEVVHAAGDEEETVQDVYDSMSQKQKDVLHFMLAQALESNANSGGSAQQSNLEDDSNDSDKEGSEMTRNVFEKDEKDVAPPQHVLSHTDIKGIVADATKLGSLKDAVEAFAISHGINDIDILFPDAVAVDNVPEFLKRRTEWVTKVMGGVRKSPFSRIKTLSADITVEEARAKGYITGTLKREEFFGVAKRVTTPTTIYKKQKLDRDDIVDITDFDVVAWLKTEMRLMLDEEIARAILIGDGRDVANEDKINEQNIRPIAKDHELYTVQVNVNLDDTNSSVTEIIDSVILNRKFYKGTGLPIMYTTETIIARFMLLKDTVGRRIYKSLDELATELRVSEIVAVEVMEQEPTIVAIIVNPIDYIMGATAGGQVSLFDDFDIDYNQYKYLIETRLCGALIKLKSAMVVKKTGATSVLVVPTAPTFNGTVITIPTVTGVAYKKEDGTTITAPQTLASGVTMVINAVPTTGYYFATSEEDTWSFTNTP
jgi:HK97 family phage prohead protease